MFLNENDKIKEIIGFYKFAIGSVLVLLIAITSGILSSIRSNEIDYLVYFGALIAYLSFIILVDLLVKLIKILKDL